MMHPLDPPGDTACPESNPRGRAPRGLRYMTKQTMQACSKLQLRAKVCPKTVLAKKRLPPMSNTKTHQPNGVVATVGKDKKKYCNKYNKTAIIRAYRNYVPSLTHYSGRNRTALILTSPYLRTTY